MNSDFSLNADFALKQNVNIVINGKPATVEGVCFYTKNTPTQYLIEYIDGNGDVTSKWVLAEDIH